MRHGRGYGKQGTRGSSWSPEPRVQEERPPSSSAPRSGPKLHLQLRSALRLRPLLAATGLQALRPAGSAHSDGNADRTNPAGPRSRTKRRALLPPPAACAPRGPPPLQASAVLPRPASDTGRGGAEGGGGGGGGGGNLAAGGGPQIRAFGHPVGPTLPLCKNAKCAFLLE